MQLELDCRSCNQDMKRERGCTEKGIVPFHLNNELIFRCPRTLVTDMTWEYICAFRFYKKNLLPSGSSYLLESRKYLSAMAIIDDAVEKTNLEKLKDSHASK